MFQSSDEKIAIKPSLIEEAEIKVENEEFYDENDEQAYYDGTRWIIICLSTVFMLHRLFGCFHNLFHDYIYVPSAVIVYILLTQKK